MAELWFAIATGVISGVVSAALLFVVRTLIVGHLLPWYHDLVYRGINVDGRWFASEYGMAQDFLMNIRQRAGAISGEAQFTSREQNQNSFEEIREFLIEGRIQDRYVTLTLSHKNRQRLGVVSFLLEPIGDGRKLQGIMSFVSMQGSNIDSIPVLLARDMGIAREKREEFELRLRQPELPLVNRNISTQESKVRRRKAKRPTLTDAVEIE